MSSQRGAARAARSSSAETVDQTGAGDRTRTDDLRIMDASVPYGDGLRVPERLRRDSHENTQRAAKAGTNDAEKFNSLADELVPLLSARDPFSGPADDFRVSHPHALSVSSFPEVGPIAKVDHRGDPSTAHTNDNDVTARTRSYLRSYVQSWAHTGENNLNYSVSFAFTVGEWGHGLRHAIQFSYPEDDVAATAVRHRSNVTGDFVVGSDGLLLEFKVRTFGNRI